MRYSVDESDALVRRKSSSLKRESNGGWEGGAVGAAAAPAHDSSVSSIGIDSMDSITSTANQLKDLMKKFDKGLCVPYDEVPIELCRPSEGTNFIDLSTWSLLVTDGTMKAISEAQHARLHALAMEYCEAHTRDFVEQAGLLDSLLSIEEGKVAFIPERMVTWRERGNLENIQKTAYKLAYDKFCIEEGLQGLNVEGGATMLTDAGIAFLTEQCKELRSIDLSGCSSFTDTSMRLLGMGCPKLEILRMRSCKGVTGPGMAIIGQHCGALKELCIADCQDVGGWALSKTFVGCPKLQVLNMSNCPKVTDDNLKALGSSCSTIQRLLLRNCVGISDAGVIAVAKGCPALNQLDLSRNSHEFKISDVSLLSLGQHCPVLQRIKLAGCSCITDVGVTWLTAGCKGLTSIDLADCKELTNAGLCGIGESCSNLKSLVLKGIRTISDVGISHVTSGCAQLEVLDLSNLYLVTDGEARNFALHGLQALARDCPGLLQLKLDHCIQVSRISLKAIGRHLHNLQLLSMAHCTNITDQGIVALASGCSSLRIVNFSGCGDSITDKIVAAFAKSCPGLEDVTLSRCGLRGSTAFKALCHFCRGLERLDVSGCHNIQDYAMMPFQDEMMHSLSWISLSKCSLISSAGFQWMVAGCPNLRTVNVQGTKVSLTTLSIVSERYPASEIQMGGEFYGLRPVARYIDKEKIIEYGRRWTSALKIQGLYRTKIARRRMEELRLADLRLWLAVQLARLWRKKKGMDLLVALRLERERRCRAATCIQSFWRMILAWQLVGRIIEAQRQAFRSSRAVEIQRLYRGLLGRRKAERQTISVARERRLRLSAAQKLQQHFRGYRARVKCSQLRAAAKRLAQLQLASAIRIQKSYRSYRARRYIDDLMKRSAARRAEHHRAACFLQKNYRQWRCRNILAELHALRASRLLAAICLQRHWRGYVQRVSYADILDHWMKVQEEAAAMRLQLLWRRYKALKSLRQLTNVKAIQKAREDQAARCLQAYCIRYRVRKEAEKIKSARLEEVRKMAQLEEWGATTIQSLVRGKAGRRKAHEMKLVHMARWKEMVDEDKGIPFYYNKITGEMRWRRPQDFLELLPRPVCSNCEQFEAQSECADCVEFFCTVCWDKVHGGGKRRRHRFRAIYDYYGKRIDYGEGEFPSLWPTDIEQDEMNGWSRRQYTSPDAPLLALEQGQGSTSFGEDSSWGPDDYQSSSLYAQTVVEPLSEYYLEDGRHQAEW